MKLSFQRLGASATNRLVDPQDWMTWAHDAGKDAGVVLTPPLVARIVLGCVDARGVVPIESAWRVVEPILDGLAASGMFASRRDVIEVTLCQPVIVGRWVLTVTLSDADEPF